MVPSDYMKFLHTNTTCTKGIMGIFKSSLHVFFLVFLRFLYCQVSDPWWHSTLFRLIIFLQQFAANSYSIIHHVLSQVILYAVHPPLLLSSFPSLPVHIHHNHSFTPAYPSYLLIYVLTTLIYFTALSFMLLPLSLSL